ncbi:hypothetical protein N7519_006667 [Penicillium mononematosum]|uniref:uncharacterized protein n=1 Tax=Penicillium mononematosum TaxID=268346 RepID=UPI00254689EF|nr:uncharacterized protein N7519_006667 [Penicillium mononematosum]KAJ6185366.1 hypothetical protein N7519_006667 [Penicillium mononematosum]
MVAYSGPWEAVFPRSIWFQDSSFAKPREDNVAISGTDCRWASQGSTVLGKIEPEGVKIMAK